MYNQSKVLIKEKNEETTVFSSYSRGDARIWGEESCKESAILELRIIRHAISY